MTTEIFVSLLRIGAVIFVVQTKNANSAIDTSCSYISLLEIQNKSLVSNSFQRETQSENIGYVKCLMQVSD